MAAWRSDSLLLIPLGAVALMALSRCAETPARENYYATRAACERDYNASECTSRSGGGGYYGPRYYGAERTTNDPGPGRTAQGGESTAATSSGVARGGFGSTGRGYGGSYG